MDVSGGGRFSHVIKTSQLSKGLRRSKRDPRNSGFMVTCSGAVGRDGVLQVLDELIRLDADIDEGFPFPQLFVFTNIIIVCGQTKIYEWDGSSLVLKLTVTAGFAWKAVDFFDYVYMSNQRVAVVRDAGSKTYSETSDLPTARAVCNFNGQVLVGAPDVTVSATGVAFGGEAIPVTVTQHGGWA